jgi:hypothetical protein
MRNLKLIYNKILKTKKIQTAYHEAGHCIVAAMFLDLLNLKALTINITEIKKINPNWRGGLNFEAKSAPSPTDYNFGDKILLIALAGICSKTVYLKGASYVNDNLSNFKSDSKLLSAEGAIDDYEMAQLYINPISQAFRIRTSYVQWSAFRFVFEFLLIPEVWSAVVYIAEELIKHDNETLLKDEILELLTDIGFVEYFTNNKSAILNKRYPLRKETLIKT